MQRKTAKIVILLLIAGLLGAFFVFDLQRYLVITSYSIHYTKLYELWRALTHWLGGMGIIVLSLAILPMLGVGGMQLFKAEVPGPVADKLTPRIAVTAQRLWLVYVGMTAIEWVLLILAGMTPYDAACHSFTTMSTGGFSTRNNFV